MRRATYALGGPSAHGKGPSRPSNSKATANTVCQKCLQRGHFTSDCQNSRIYTARPTRTQQLLNPAKRPKLLEGPEEPIRVAGTADKLLASKERERSKAAKRSASPSSSSVSSVSSVSSSSDSRSSRSRSSSGSLSRSLDSRSRSRSLPSSRGRRRLSPDSKFKGKSRAHSPVYSLFGDDHKRRRASPSPNMDSS